MPVKSLNSPVLKWPDRAQVDAAVRHWATRQARLRPELQAVGYFGSYARGDWGVGSDLDLIVVVTETTQPFERRGQGWDTQTLPVPVDLLVYTPPELDTLRADGGRFARVLDEETVWVYPPS